MMVRMRRRLAWSGGVRPAKGCPRAISVESRGEQTRTKRVMRITRNVRKPNVYADQHISTKATYGTRLDRQTGSENVVGLRGRNARRLARYLRGFRHADKSSAHDLNDSRDHIGSDEDWARFNVNQM